MEKELLYHGSNEIVQMPRILINGHYKDFGYGFYCTNILRQAKRWAITRKGASVVNLYCYKNISDLKIISFDKMTEEWLNFVVSCRSGIEHQYDIVEGPMADDQIWDYVEDYIEKRITREAFWELVKFKFPTHQIAFCTEKALTSLEYEGSEIL